MAHEVKTPLATLNMGAKQLNNMIQNSASTEELSEMGRLINKVTAQGISTVENLLTSLRQTSTTSEEGTCRINEIIMEVLEEYYQHRTPTKSPVVKLNSNFEFYGSKHLVKHAIENLLNNAYKHGGRDIQVTIQTNNNKLYVKDDGQGISSEHLPFIFDKFYTQGHGTGIGLAFCKTVMEDMGGSIQCHSKPNKLTTFTLEFPKV